MGDVVHERVVHAVESLRGGPSREGLESVVPLSELEPDVLLPELFFQVEEAAADRDLSLLRPTALVLESELEDARNIIRAVRAQDIELLRSSVGGGYPELVSSLLSVAAALRDSFAEPVEQG